MLTLVAGLLAILTRVHSVKVMSESEAQQDFDKTVSSQEEWLQQKINTGREPVFCTDNGLRSPINLEGDMVLQEFTVSTAFTPSFDSNVTRVSDHVYKLQGDFGRVEFNSRLYDVFGVYFKGPSEHEIAGERLPLELQIVARNQKREHIGMVLLFRVADLSNPLLSLIGFGKDILSKLDFTDYLNPQKHTLSDLALNLQPFMPPSNQWYMYKGHDLNPPCSNITWLISGEPQDITIDQLTDFNPMARPDFTLKTIGERTIYHNTPKPSDKNLGAQLGLNSSTHALLLQAEEMKRLVDLKRQKELEKIKNEEAVKRAQMAALNKLVEDYRKNKTASSFKDPPRIGEEPIITEGLMRSMFDEITKFNFLHSVCKDYVKYIPALDKKYGYVPPDGIMTWEIINFMLDNKNITIPKGESLPQPVNSSYVYRIFYYIPRPDCHKNNSMMKLLAQTSARLATNKTNETLAYVPVFVESSPDFLSPDYPATTFKMAVPGKTPELQEVIIQRQFIPETNPLPLQDLALAKKYNQTAGYNIAPVIERPLILAGQPSGSVDSRGRVIRIWPQLITSRDGLLPQDGIFAWDGIKESELVLNSTLPPSFNSEYRWILLMYLQANYWVGEQGNIPLLPVYILARKDFHYTKNKIPEFIPVPQNTEITEGEVKAELLTLVFTAKNGSSLLNDSKILDKPVGYDGKKIFTRANSFREKSFLRQAAINIVYFGEVHARYLNTTEGRPADLLVQEKEEVTGIILQEDPAYRKQLSDELKRQEDKVKTQLRKQADRKSKIEAIYQSPNRIVTRQRICTDWNLEIVLNDRVNFIDKGKETMDQRNCIRWEWKEVIETNPLYQPPSPTTPAPSANSTESRKNKQEEIKKKVLIELEDYCLNKLHVVLNDRQFQAKDEYYELCKKTIDQLRKTRMKLFMVSLGPALQLLKDKALENSDNIAKLNNKIEKAVSKKATAIGDKIKVAGENIANIIDKKKTMAPGNTTTSQLARLNSRSNSLSKAKSKNKTSLLDRLQKAARKLWTRY